ncbi:MAG TPA: hypothetical protein VMJ75_01290 [Candidatus Acidoferrales bacterium]|nr:hypothetical protein [Candidatus Acidoferrales bacterium]
MKRRAYIAGAFMGVTLALSAAAAMPSWRLVSSAHSFQRHFRELKRSDVSTVERLVFSLVLAHSER